MAQTDGECDCQCVSSVRNVSPVAQSADKWTKEKYFVVCVKPKSEYNVTRSSTFSNM